MISLSICLFSKAYMLIEQNVTTLETKQKLTLYAIDCQCSVTISSETIFLVPL